MQPVDTGGPIVGRHDPGEEPLCLADSTWTRVWDLNVLKCEGALALLVEAVLRCEAGTLLVSSMRGKLAFEANGKRVFLVGKLVDEVAGVTPEREIV